MIRSGKQYFENERARVFIGGHLKSIVLKIEPGRDLLLPFSHFHALQGLVYELLSYDPVLSAELHDKRNGNTDALKLFCFSEVRGRHSVVDRKLVFPGPFFFEVRSAEDAIVDTIAERVMRDSAIMVDGCVCRVSGMRTDSISFNAGALELRANTPITTYRTGADKRRIYYSPFDSEFYEIVSNNLARKYKLLYGREYDEELSFFCPAPEKCKKVVARYKGDFITAFLGDYRFEASGEMLEIAYYCGLGSKNSMGLGFVDLR